MKLYRGLYEASAQMREKRFNKARHMYLSLCREYPDSFYAFFGLAASKYGTVFVKENGESNHSGSNSSNNNNNIAAPAEGYEDGTYTGSAACSGEQFKEYSVTANVTIKNGKISNKTLSKNFIFIFFIFKF